MPELVLEHKSDGKKRKLLRVQPRQKLFVIGSSKDADLRIGGEGVKGCHAALRLRDGGWYICDITGDDALVVNGQRSTEVKLSGSDAIEIGAHRLQLFTRERETDLFTDSSRVAGQGSALALHQVVVRVRGRVQETKLLKATQAYTYEDGGQKKSLPAPVDGKWTKTTVGARIIQQRLVSSQEALVAEKLTFDHELRRAVAFALIFFAVTLGTVFLIGRSQKDASPQVVLDNKSRDIIFNAKAVKKKKLEAQKVTKAAAAKSGGNPDAAPQTEAKAQAPDQSQAPKVSEKASAALTSLRKSGLSNLIGKIAKRANKQGTLVAAVGTSADNANAGRALFSTGTSTTGGGGAAAKEGSTFRLGGVATRGKAGGVGNFKDGTALAGGNVGSGNIVAMVDDETVIEGGLDRDAIAEVIRRNLGQIRYCYERQLSSNPDLYGKVLVKFTIDSSGHLTEPQVGTSTLKSAMVEGCIMRRMASWKFPEPKGGTQVHVSYPFLFKAN